MFCKSSDRAVLEEQLCNSEKDFYDILISGTISERDGWKTNFIVLVLLKIEKIAVQQFEFVSVNSATTGPLVDKCWQG